MSLPAGGQVDSSLSGTYVASPIRFMIYGLGTAKKLNEVVGKLGASKAYIITGQSLSTKTPVIKDAEASLGSMHVGTFNKIGQHAPIGAIREATELVKASGADVLISIGGGSPIDSAKAVAYQIHEATGKWIPSIAVPTTLSVAETTQNAGFTTEEKKKIAVSHPELVPKAVVYDGNLALYTPTNLWTSTGIRSLDHAIELLYHPLASEIPTKRLALTAIQDLFTYLPLSKAEPENAEYRQKLFLACYASLFPFLYTGGVGLSHSIGHALGATYGIPHGITSCLTLAPVVELKARTKPDDAKMIARAIPYIGKPSTGSDEEDAKVVSKAIAELVEGLGHKSTLTGYKVPPGEEESIALHALVGGKGHPDFENLINIVHNLY
ncbi:related to Lactaldehyde reductase [Phialocephala subalpina]|uniref:Related to Lactaldehyde reductase n=1 Tax=Phialocephala subalpina TaxID=576137 RepID=A0A1L7XDG2_9HELO|nr:related to Lactaldehyde reductase [Phialocephala subalpina]